MWACDPPLVTTLCILEITSLHHSQLYSYPCIKDLDEPSKFNILIVLTIIIILLNYCDGYGVLM